MQVRVSESPVFEAPTFFSVSCSKMGNQDEYWSRNPTMNSPSEISRNQARRLLMGAQGLLENPDRRGGQAALSKLIQQLGFVQMDSINVVERAHHLTLHSRLDAYRQGHFAQALEEDRQV